MMTRRTRIALLLLGLWGVMVMGGACSPSPEMERALTMAMRLALLFHSGASAEPREAETGLVASGVSVGEPTPTPTPPLVIDTYEVQPGDTLWAIAQRYDIPVETLQIVNELDDPNHLSLGQRLLISDRVTVSGVLLPTPTPTPIPCYSGCPYPESGCAIKGVRARLDGTPMYLLPGDQIYAATTAEVWFCREEDAQREGWLRWTIFGPTPQENVR